MRNRMRRIITAALAVMMLAAVLAGCGGKKEEEGIQACAEGFLTGLTNGDPVEVSKYSNMSNSDIMIMMDPEAMAADIYDSMEIDPGTLEEPAKNSMIALCRSIRSTAVTSYEITEVTVNKGAGHVEARVRWIGDAQELFSEATDEAVVNEVVTAFVDSHQEELAEAAADEDETALMTMIYNGILPEILSRLEQTVSSATPAEDNCVMTIEKVGGAWTVTDFILPAE